MLFRWRLLIELLASHQFGCDGYKWTGRLFLAAERSWATLPRLCRDSFTRLLETRLEDRVGLKKGEAWLLNALRHQWRAHGAVHGVPREAGWGLVSLCRVFGRAESCSGQRQGARWEGRLFVKASFGAGEFPKASFSRVIKIWIILKSVVAHLLELFAFN